MDIIRTLSTVLTPISHLLNLSSVWNKTRKTGRFTDFSNL